MSGLVSACHLSPVHHVPENVDVLQAAVPVLEVVGVLPQVQPQHGRLALHERRVLVGRRLYRERAVWIDDQPGPARAEQCPGCRRGEPLLEAFERAKTPGDSLREVLVEIPVAAHAGARGQQSPEYRVVSVTAAVVADGGANILGDGVELGDQDIHVARVCFGVLLERSVEVGDVGTVVLLVVEAHGPFVYVRLQSVVGVGQCRQLVSHRVSSFLVGFARDMGYYGKRTSIARRSLRLWRSPTPQAACAVSGRQRAPETHPPGTAREATPYPGS